MLEQRAARWKGQSHVDYAFHITLAGALPLRVFEQIPEAIQQGHPSFKVFTTNILPPHPKRAGNRLDFGRIGLHRESRRSLIPFPVDAREVIILTRPHVVAEFFHVDWTSRARRKIGVPVLHLLEHENFDEQAGGGEGVTGL